MELTVNQFITIGSVFFGSIILGWIVEKIVLARLKIWSKKTKWKGDDAIVQSLQHMILPWFLVMASHYIVYFLPLGEELQINLLTFIKVVYIILGTALVLRFVTKLSKIGDDEEGDESLSQKTSIIQNLIKVFIIIIGAMVVLQALGISITPILTAMGVGGLAVALALQDTLSNLFAGIQILISKQVRTGDFIRLESGQDGFVQDITWRNTTIKALPNHIVVIPNSKLANAIVTNFSLPDKEIAVTMDVSVSYDSNLELVEKITVEAAIELMQAMDESVKSFVPFIRYKSFGDSGIALTVIMRAKEYTDQNIIRHEFLKILHAKYKQNGIIFPFPTRTVYLKNESK